MRNFKTSIKILIAMAFLNSSLSLAQNPIANKAPIVSWIKGPINGQLIIPPTSTPQSISCVVNGVTISTSGTTNYTYIAPNTSVICAPSAPFVGLGNWTGALSGGTITYSFSQPVISARISYSVIDSTISSFATDQGYVVTNSLFPTQFSDPCGVSVSGNLLTCNLPPGTYGDVGVTISAAAPFTTITLTNYTTISFGNSGWVVGNPCNFTFTLPPPPSPTIINCPKVTLDTLYFYANSIQNTTLSVFTAGSGAGCPQATINGVPCTAANVTIEPITPLASGCTFNTNGTIRVPLGTLPFSGESYYRFRSIANPSIYSQNFRVNYGVHKKVFASNNNGFSLYLETPSSPNTINNYPNANRNVLTGSTINPNNNGTFGSIPATASNVTITNLPTQSSLFTKSGDLYFMVNPNGDVVYRPGIFASDVQLPNSPSTQYSIKYSMCMNSNLFCDTADFVFNYVSLSTNRPTLGNINLQTLLVAPNPSSNGVYKLSVSEVVAAAIIEVYTMMGQKVFSEQISQFKEHDLLLDKLPKGTYLLKVLSNDQSISKNIVKL